ncbi:MAG: hypothetical protein HOG49_38240 [Candidatus Scalindua sp.]|jgi:hypothetical protein|nr:hypothetical protein [Candidatus Scalindua sp.]
MGRKSKLNIKLKKKIITEYIKGKSTSFLGKKYDIGAASIYYLLSKENIAIRNRSEAQRKYQLNESFFDEIDSQNKAYFMGMLYADGCNSTEQNAIRIILTKKDRIILEKLSSLIFKEHRPLTLRKGGYFESKGKMYFRKDSYQLLITNKHISKTLNELGLIKNKSLIITFPSWIKKDLTSHFIRGYFDGDGCVSLSSGQLSISILGTENFCSGIQNITKKLSIKSSICNAKKGSEIKQFIIHGNQSGRKFLEWMYKGSTIYLDRKHEKFLSFMDIIPDARKEKCCICGDKHYGKGYCKKHHYEKIGKKLRRERYLKSKK